MLRCGWWSRSASHDRARLHDRLLPLRPRRRAHAVSRHQGAVGRRPSRRSSTGCRRGTTSSTARRSSAPCVPAAAFDRPTALLTFDDGFVDHYEHVFPLLRARGLGGIFFISGATLARSPAPAERAQDAFPPEPSRRRPVHRGGRGGARSASRRRRCAPAGARAGIYRYDEAPDVRVKRILNYEAPYPVADRVLSTLFERHLGDSVDFARASVSLVRPGREMAAGGMTFGFHTETHPVLSRLDPRRAAGGARSLASASSRT